MRWLLPALLVVSLAGCADFEQRLFEFGLRVERERADLVAGVVDLDGYHLAYLERPADGEVIVLLHGFASEKDAWTRFSRFIPDHYRIIAFDLPGHGDSSRDPDATYDVAYLTARLAEGFEELGLERVHIAGNSLGGLVALLYAHGHPERVATLGLFNAAGVLPPGESEFERMLGRGENPLIVDSRADFERLMALVFEDEPLMPWPVASVLTRRFIERAAFNEKIWQDIWARRTEVTGLLTAIEPPVLIVWGDHDRILDVSSIDVFARWLPRSEVHVLMDTGHSPMLERPWRSAGLYRSFLSRNARR